MNIAIITGASSGMGKDFARQLAEKSIYDEIWIIARRKQLLDELAEEINSKVKKNLVVPLAMDLCDKKSVLELQKLLEGKNLTIGMLVNNAGFGIYGPFENTSVNREMDMVELNCTALTGICGIALPYLQENSIIINTASLASFIPLGNFSVYGATKAFVLSFTMALAAELKDKKIKVCALCPGPVSTEFANVASNGAREKVRHGLPSDKVVAHCLNKAFKGKRMAIYSFKWKFKAIASRFVGRYLGARFTYKYSKRPHNPDLY
ncbi:MAG: SDR family NAD(P)-dependent oxidoreductase [Treponema sp.]|nr:SDR family NAD(P)-dependent oxidoreductase [Treponema sp.]